MSFESQPATRAGGPRPDAADDAGDPPGDLYQPSHFQGADTGAQDLAQPSHFGNTQDLAQPSHFGTGESLTQLTARMSVLESVSRRATRSSLDNVASMRAGPGATPSTATSMRAAAMRAAAKRRSNPPTPKPSTPPPEAAAPPPPEPPTPAPPSDDEDVAWVDALGSLDPRADKVIRDQYRGAEDAKTPRVFARDPVSVGVIRGQYRERRRREERREEVRIEQVQLARKPRPVQQEGSSESEGDAAPVVQDPPNAKKLYNLCFGDIVEGTARKEELVKSIEDELNNEGTVLLVADPAANEDDEASCRAVLRTLHMALHPKLRDPIPPLPLKRADGSFGMTLRAPAPRRPMEPY